MWNTKGIKIWREEERERKKYPKKKEKKFD